ncbi:MAG: 23S rRNA (pseudouridine(1915)-N(3))-methyltransferase RlmH [Acidobacteriota bacterium]
MAKRGVTGLAVVWVGRRGSPAVEELAVGYRDRIVRFVPCVEIRIRPAAGRGGDPARAVAVEGVAIRSHLRPGDAVVALDERGRERTTEEFSTWLATRLPAGRVVFVIGSDLGLDGSVKTLARESFSLSRLTLPHQLARVVLLEQLYRSLDLASGGSYHRSGEGSHV